MLLYKVTINCLVKMGSYLAVAFTLLLSMACHAQTVSLGQLTNTKWKLTKPVFSYCDKTMSFTSTEMTNTSISHYVKRGETKETKRFFSNSYPFYLATAIPTTFNRSLVGKSSTGTYIIKYVGKRVVAFKVLGISNAQLKLSTPQGDVLVYDKID